MKFVKDFHIMAFMVGCLLPFMCIWNTFYSWYCGTLTLMRATSISLLYTLDIILIRLFLLPFNYTNSFNIWSSPLLWTLYSVWVFLFTIHISEQVLHNSWYIWHRSISLCCISSSIEHSLNLFFQSFAHYATLYLLDVSPTSSTKDKDILHEVIHCQHLPNSVSTHFYWPWWWLQTSEP